MPMRLEGRDAPGPCDAVGGLVRWPPSGVGVAGRSRRRPRRCPGLTLTLELPPKRQVLGALPARSRPCRRRRRAGVVRPAPEHDRAGDDGRRSEHGDAGCSGRLLERVRGLTPVTRERSRYGLRMSDAALTISPPTRRAAATCRPSSGRAGPRPAASASATGCGRRRRSRSFPSRSAPAGSASSPEGHLGRDPRRQPQHLRRRRVRRGQPADAPPDRHAHRALAA